MDAAGAASPRMVQVGGAAGRIVPAWAMDVPLSFETILGSGAVIVYNESRDVIDIVRRTLNFFAEESCGKCTPCREGTEMMVEILERLAAAQAGPDDIEALEIYRTPWCSLLYAVWDRQPLWPSSILFNISGGNTRSASNSRCSSGASGVRGDSCPEDPSG